LEAISQLNSLLNLMQLGGLCIQSALLAQSFKRFFNARFQVP